jgi:hypothetical protein
MAKKSKPEMDSRDWWGEDKDFPLADWRYAVANDDTRLGYWEWVEASRG